MRRVGWYWVKIKTWRNEPPGEWEPALWDGGAFDSARWSGYREDAVDVGSEIIPPGKMVAIKKYNRDR